MKKESNYSCSGVIKAHDLAINSIKVFEHNGAVSFITSSDDMYVKIFSLQKVRYGPLMIQTLGVIDLKNPYNHSTEWLFPFDNQDFIKHQKEKFKEVLKNIVTQSAHEENDAVRESVHTIDGQRIIIKDPRKEKLEKQEEIKY